MANESVPDATPSAHWRPGQVLALSMVCLAIGVLLGYFLKGSAPVAFAPSAATTAAAPTMPVSATAPAAPSAKPGDHPQISLDDMRRMADSKAAPLLEKLKANPKDAVTLNQLGILYRATHQFKEAEGYFEKSLEVNPKNTDARVDLASCLYYTGDVDGAIAQLNKALSYEPKDPHALMNLGIMQLKGKNDTPAAIATWEKLLKLNPDFPQKDAVQRMINDAQQEAKS